MDGKLLSIGEAAEQLDTAVCEVCNLCGDLRMSMGHREDDEEQDGVDHTSARLLQQELRHMRNTYTGLKNAVDAILDDHEKRIRSMDDRINELNNQKYMILGGGAVAGWIFSVVLRLFFK